MIEIFFPATKKRLGKKSPQVCFAGIELKNMYDNDQETEM